MCLCVFVVCGSTTPPPCRLDALGFFVLILSAGAGPLRRNCLLSHWPLPRLALRYYGLLSTPHTTKRSPRREAAIHAPAQLEHYNNNENKQ